MCGFWKHKKHINEKCKAELVTLISRMRHNSQGGTLGGNLHETLLS